MKLSSFLPSKLAILCGVLSSLASPVGGWWFLIFIVFTPFFLVVDRNRGWSLFKETMWIQFIFALGVFFWVPEAMKNLWESPWWINYPFFLILGCIVELQFVFFGFITRFLLDKIKSKLILVFLIPAFYAACDFIYPKFFEDTASHALFSKVNFISHFGFPYSALILTWLVVGVANTWTFFLAREKKWKSLLSVWAIFALVVHFTPSKKLDVTKTLEVWSINYNINFKEKKSEDYLKKVFEDITWALKEIPSSEKNQLVVFPETILPFDFQNPQSLKEELMKSELIKLSLDKNLSVLIGGGVLVGNDKKNRMFFINTESGQEKISFSEKKILFPFGEYIPGGQIFPWWQSLFPSNMLVEADKSENHTLFSWNNLTFGVAICYEGLFPYFIADIQREHPQVDFIVNSTNETWFDNFGEPELSFALTQFSALENNLPIVRPTNAGTGGAIDSRGRPLDYIRFKKGDKPLIRHYKVPLTK